MAQPQARCNPTLRETDGVRRQKIWVSAPVILDLALVGGGVVDDLYPAFSINQRDVKTHLGILAKGFIGNEFAGRTIYPCHLCL
jgi:hypothetical protein